MIGWTDMEVLKLICMMMKMWTLLTIGLKQTIVVGVLHLDSVETTEETLL